MDAILFKMISRSMIIIAMIITLLFFLIKRILIGVFPSCLDLPRVLTSDYKQSQGVVIKKSEMSIWLENGMHYRVGKVDWCEKGDCVQLTYLPFTRYATITNIVKSHR
ncbi:MAG: hypothetical protein UGF43_11510 [Blautia sp.]|uniref:hypothetical protein n=1 Tax=Blautia sp. TaxID=1955243 RepID=UPI002E7A4C7F|nr:hypothetical protein [Blautia sp.]MEE1444218.1 hypothetical protein [Blautia sp.]